MYKFGYHFCKPDHVCGPWSWNNFLFHYVISGKGRLLSHDDTDTIQEYDIEAGQGFVFWPGQVVTFTADEKDPWEYIWVEFNGLRAKEMVLQAGLQYNHPVYTTADPSQRDIMAAELKFIVDNPNRPAMELMGHLYGFISAMVHSSAQLNLIEEGSLQDFYAQKAIDYISQHYHRDLTVQEVADHCNVHRSYLHRIFTACLNTPPQQFLINYRVRKACELLKTTEHSISEISSLVGYTNPLVFSRIFKKEMKKSPRDWKKLKETIDVTPKSKVNKIKSRV